MRTRASTLEISDAAWAAIAPHMPARAPGPGRPARDHRTVVAGILWVLENDAAWRHAPLRYGPWQTLYARYSLWATDGTWDRVTAALRTARRRELRRARAMAVMMLATFAAFAPQPLRAERLGGRMRAERHQMAHAPDRVGRRRARKSYVSPDPTRPALS